VWSKFDEGWKRKGGVEMGEKWRRSGAADVGRPEAKVKGEEEERKGKGECFGGCFGVRVIE
jgi:hypothetical protein